MGGDLGDMTLALVWVSDNDGSVQSRPSSYHHIIIHPRARVTILLGSWGQGGA
jgi:hypothetical protein